MAYNERSETQRGLYCTRFGFDLNRMKCVAVSDLSACVLFWTASVYLRMQCLCSAAVWLCSHVCFALNCYCISFIWFNLIKRFRIAIIGFSVTEPHFIITHIHRETHTRRKSGSDRHLNTVDYLRIAALQHFSPIVSVSSPIPFKAISRDVLNQAGCIFLPFTSRYFTNIRDFLFRWNAAHIKPNLN